MQNTNILWADDEIDRLKPHILFLNQKGYQVKAVCSGLDALEQCEKTHYDLVFLDENMPGMSGLETLQQIKTMRPNLPVIMITKSEEESIMEEAIASKIADYLIKPVNPNQILLSIKKCLDKKRLIAEYTNHSYQQDFRNIGMAFNDVNSFQDWSEVYKKLVFWELEMDKAESNQMREVLVSQKEEANVNFTKFVRENYETWFSTSPPSNTPLMSHKLIANKILPLLKDDESVFFILVDNLRLDQWRMLEPIIAEYYNTIEDSLYCSILPTTTAYARNAIFAGLTPLEISYDYPQLWADDDEEGTKNNFEDEFLRRLLQRRRLDHIKMSYHKILNNKQGKALNESLKMLLSNHLNAVVYNFVDALSHARTDVNVIRELAPDESAYRAVTLSWFLHSPLLEMLKWLASHKVKVVITTDHGTIRTEKPFKIVGDKNTNTNLRYKQGKNLNFQGKNIVMTRKPDSFGLPSPNVSTSYVFATEDHFFAYPNNYNHYVKYYKDTFQHGGVSMEEMLIPFILLEPRS
ncbi:MAG: PglZ domain-containing protein [Cytophagales bacterium]|nr:MAG: PglZ domain-containing protein [Cytophagales bacterium]TAF61364.1 MAG: PglZ domain-containing protein [Cytophagales bacterium]